MNTPPSPPPKPDALPSAARRGAYLVLRTGSRWSDVFRLSAPAEAVIGRSSGNQIVLRSDQASRRHARIRWSNEAENDPASGGGAWVIEDLGSRNGTFVNSRKIEGTIVLVSGDIVSVAGFAITFTHKIDSSAVTANPKGDSGQATDDQITMEIDPSSITDQRRQSSYLHSGGLRSNISAGKSPDASLPLLQLAFALARESDPTGAVETVLDCIVDQVPIDTAGVYLRVDRALPSSEIPLVATRQSSTRSYRCPPESLVIAVTARDGQATLARNVAGDGQLATENSRGEIEVDSLILAPVRSSDGSLWGMVHVTTANGGKPLSSFDLEFVVAATEILAASLVNQLEREKLDKALHRSRRTIEQLTAQLGNKVRLIGRSEPIKQVIEQITLAAPTDATVLVRGESGVGKELVGAALHHAGKRREGPLVCLNCAALSPTLLESELFGHEKGAFTGATDRKRGKFEMADGGTLMLDEIGEMSHEVQAKFLRVLEGHPFERVGGHEAIRTDVRIVAATNRDLQKMVAEKSFRQDLFYRLNVIEIIVPPLRARGGDIVLLADYFLTRFNLEMGRRIEGITDVAKKRLLAHSWPGNIRELKNVIERAVVLNRKNVIDEDDLALTPSAASVSRIASDGEVPTEMTLADLEREHIERVLRFTEGNKSRAASILGIERSTLDRKLKKYE